jgi:hypothetical protein
LQKPARTTDPVDVLIRKGWTKRLRSGDFDLLSDTIERDISKATGLTLDRINGALAGHRMP